MTPPIENFIESPSKPRVQIGLAPAQNAVNSLLLLTKTEMLSGLSDWVMNTEAQLSDEERKQHRLIMYGFYNAIIPEKDWHSFPAYLNHLKKMDPEALRDKMLQSYLNYAFKEGVPDHFTKESIIASEEEYLRFLKERFDKSLIDEGLERWAYSYVINPLAMQKLMTSHLQKYWDNYLSAEWERGLPMLQKVVNSFQPFDYSQMNNFEAAKYVTGQTLDEEHWETMCNQATSVFFAPSLHVGPYLGRYHTADQSFGIIFGARLPDNTSIYAPELSQMEIYVRLNALADETRLRILKYISTNGERCSAEIISELNLSQSAASRHLSQLTATGYLIARRKDGAKCFRLDKDRITSTFDTINNFLNIL